MATCQHQSSHKAEEEDNTHLYLYLYRTSIWIYYSFRIAMRPILFSFGVVGCWVLILLFASSAESANGKEYRCDGDDVDDDDDDDDDVVVV